MAKRVKSPKATKDIIKIEKQLSHHDLKIMAKRGKSPKATKGIIKTGK
ncbi:MAG: hypothetical protein AB4041_05675 [Microcystaceae cyanobacterium]